MLLRWSLVCAALFGSIFSTLWAWAAYQFELNTPLSVEAAVRTVPYNAKYLAWLAYLKPEQKVELLERAAALNPYDSQSLVQLGLNAELRDNDAKVALKYYLQAASVDKTYLPKWTLTNFYFRQGNDPEFFKWSKATLEITPNSPFLVFDQMWSMSQDQDRIALAISNRRDVLLNYVSYLNRLNRWSAIPPIIDRIIAETPLNAGIPPAGLKDIIGPAEDGLLYKGHFAAALHVWSSLSRAHWIGLGIPNAASPVTNGSFDHEPLRQGMDWRPSLHIVNSPKSNGLRLQFDGCLPKHWDPNPESCLLLSQYVPLAGGRSYSLSWQADTNDLGSPSGIAWTMDGQKGTSQSADLAVSSSNSWQFQVPPLKEYGRLELWYRRPRGTALNPGTFTLHSVNLTER